MTHTIQSARQRLALFLSSTIHTRHLRLPLSGVRRRQVFTLGLPAWVLLALLAAPQGTAASTLTLAWEPSTTPDVIGYVVYVGREPGSYADAHDTGGATSWTLPNPVPGQLYCFAVAAYTAGPLLGPHSSEVCAFSNAPPLLSPPGNHTSAVGEQVTLQLQGSDPENQPVSYAATGLPPGIALTTSTGFIAGAAHTAGTYTVTASVTDGTLVTSQTFTWSVVSTGVDTTPPVLTITSPTTSDTYSISSPSIVLRGTATDDIGVAGVYWSSNRSGSGTATGTADWEATVALQRGANTITVTAMDQAGNRGSRTLVVTW